MKKKQEGYNFILFSTMGILVASWFGYELVPNLALSVAMSFMILDLAGVFNIKRSTKNVKAGVVRERLVLNMEDRDGEKSSVIIEPDGKIKTEGNVSADIIHAARELQKLGDELTPTEMAEELNKQFNKKK